MNNGNTISKAWRTGVLVAGLVLSLVLGMSPPAQAFTFALKPNLNPVEPTPHRPYQPAPMYQAHREHWNDPTWPAAVPESDTNRKPCLSLAVQNRMGPMSATLHAQCNDYTTALVQGPSVTGVPSKVSPHHLSTNPVLYWPFSPLALSFDAGSPINWGTIGWNYTQTYPYTGAYGWFDAVVVPGLTPDGTHVQNLLFANSLSDIQMDKIDNIVPFLDLTGKDENDPVNMAFEPDLLEITGDGILPIATATGNFVRKLPAHHGAAFPGVTKIVQALYRIWERYWDVAVLSRGNAPDGPGYLNVVKHAGIEPNYDACVKPAFDAVCGVGNDPVSNPAGAQACVAIPANQNAISNQVTGCPGVLASEYASSQVYDQTLLEETSNVVDMFSVPEPLKLRASCVEIINEATAAATCSALCGRCANCSFGAVHPVGPGSYAQTCNDQCRQDFGDVVPVPLEFPAECAGVALSDLPECWISSKWMDTYYGGAGSNTCDYRPEWFPHEWKDKDKLQFPLLAVVNRTGENCFNKFLRFRNPLIEPILGKVVQGDGIVVPQNTDTNGYPDMEDTHGITYFKDGGGSETVMPGDAGSNNCSYLTLYTIDMTTGKPVPNVIKVTSPAGNTEAVKLPIGYNTSHCSFGLDVNADGEYRDILCTNLGSPSEGIYGSMTLLVCPADNMNGDRLLPDPNAAEETWRWLCGRGFVAYDFPITDDDVMYPSKHPNQLTTAVFKPKEYTFDTTIKPGGVNPLGKTGHTAADFAVTYLDDNADGAFTVHLNDIDTLYNAKGKNVNYMYGNIDVSLAPSRFAVTTVKTAPLEGGGAATYGPALPKVASAYSPKPAGITHGHFTNSGYDGAAMGLDIIFNDLVSQDFMIPGFAASHHVGGGTIHNWTVDPAAGLSVDLDTQCNDVAISFHNTRPGKTCIFRNKKGKLPAWMGAVGAPCSHGHPCQVCTGEFELPDPNDPKSQVLCTDSASPVYSVNSSDSGVGNWGGKQLAQTKTGFAIDIKIEVQKKPNSPLLKYDFDELIQFSMSDNVQTERGMQENHATGGFAPNGFYVEGLAPSGYRLDVEIDMTPDNNGINGPFLIFPEQQVLNAGLVAAYDYPSVTCDTPNYETAANITKTDGNGDKWDIIDSFRVKAGPNPRPIHRCWQRHNGDGMHDLYSEAAIGCCQLLEGPSQNYLGYNNVPGMGTTCPGESPFECCLLQNSDTWRNAQGLGPVNNTYGPGDTAQTDAVFDAGSPICECGQDVLDEWNNLIAQSILPACQANPPAAFCPTLAEVQTAMDNLCECSGDAFPWCDNPDDLTCDDIFPVATLPKANQCCHDSGAVTLMDMIAAGAADNCPDTDMDEDDCNVTLTNVTINGNVCICNEINVSGDLTGSALIDCSSGGGGSTVPQAELCPEGLLQWKIENPEKSVEINGKSYEQVVYRIDGDGADLVLDMTVNNGQVLQELGLLAAGDGISALASDASATVELYQVQGSHPKEITSSTSSTGIASVDGSPLSSGKSLVANASLNVSSPETWNMIWRLYRTEEGHTPTKQIQQFEVSLNNNAFTCVTPALVTAIEVGGGHGGCSLVRDGQIQDQRKLGWIVGLLGAGFITLLLMWRRKGTTN